MGKIKFLIIQFLVLFFGGGQLLSQEWELVKEKDGIKVYSRLAQTGNLKSFKGEIDIQSDTATVLRLLEDVRNFDRWDEDVSEIRVLEQQKGLMLKYYVVYNVPWPFKDRDLCVEAYITRDQASGSTQIVARSVPETVPYNDELERIVEYWQKWTIQPTGNGIIHLVVEGFADPAGDIPAWIVNLAITDTPFNMLKSIKDEIVSAKDAK